jgi:hypothetical protein
MRGLGLLQLARELEETARVVSGILRVIQGQVAQRPRTLPARAPAPPGPVRPGEVRRVRVEYIPPGKLKRKRR